eukprot:jgi/Chlat1/6500/Chrsp45S05988
MLCAAWPGQPGRLRPGRPGRAAGVIMAGRQRRGAAPAPAAPAPAAGQTMLSRFFAPKATSPAAGEVKRATPDDELPAPEAAPSPPPAAVIKLIDDVADVDAVSDDAGEELHTVPPSTAATTPPSPLVPARNAARPFSKARKATAAFDPVARHKEYVSRLLARSDSQGGTALHARSSNGHQSSRPGMLTGQKLTPLEQQVVEFKEKYPDVLLMVEVGYKYRFFGADAEIAAKVLGIFAHYNHSFLTASIPTFRLHVHVRRLVEAGYKVGVVRQTETAAIKATGANGNRSGPFTRDLSALYTRATLEAAADLGGDTQPGREIGTERMTSYLVCITEERVEGEQGQGGRGGALAHDARIGFLAVEASTGDIIYDCFTDSVLRNELQTHLSTIPPAEVLMQESLHSATERLINSYCAPTAGVRVERMTVDESGAASVVDFYGEEQGEEASSTLAAVLELPQLVLKALTMALNYLRQFGLEEVLRNHATFRSFASAAEMTLSPNALNQLEILSSNLTGAGNERGSLLHLLDHTCTPFGRRQLREWVCRPLKVKELIEERLEAVEELIGVADDGIGRDKGFARGSRGAGVADMDDGPSVSGRSHKRQRRLPSSSPLAALAFALVGLPDLDRGLARMFHRTATPAEFLSTVSALTSVSHSLSQAGFEEDFLNSAIKSLLLRRLVADAVSPKAASAAAELLAALDAKSVSAGDKCGMFVCEGGRFPQVAECRRALQQVEGELDAELIAIRKKLRMPRLEYRTIAVTEYLIEVTVGTSVPSDWLRVNSTKKEHRYHPPRVANLLERRAVKKEELTATCTRAWVEFLKEVAAGEGFTQLRQAARALAAIDALHSLAVTARSPSYVRPQFVSEDESPQIDIVSGRHPILDAVLNGQFVPNETRMEGDGERCLIITGPNMGGKSCYVKGVALIAIMAQVGSFVPADSVRMHVVDAVHVRMGASDALAAGRSTFFEEVSEAATVLLRATPRSLVVLDELGRGTSTHDGVAIAYATLQHLVAQTQCLTLFVTHYPSVASLCSEYPRNVGAYYVSYLAERPAGVNDGDTDMHGADRPEEIGSVADGRTDHVTFLYKLVPGLADRSFGMHVARMAEVPETVIMRAAQRAAEFEEATQSRESGGASCATDAVCAPVCDARDSSVAEHLVQIARKLGDDVDVEELCRLQQTIPNLT